MIWNKRLTERWSWVVGPFSLLLYLHLRSPFNVMQRSTGNLTMKFQCEEKVRKKWGKFLTTSTHFPRISAGNVQIPHIFPHTGKIKWKIPHIFPSMNFGKFSFPYINSTYAENSSLFPHIFLTLKFHSANVPICQWTICVMTSCSIPEHPSRPFLDQTLREHSGGLVGRAAK